MRKSKNTVITPESVLLTVQETAARVTAEVKEMLAASRAEFDLKMEKSRAEFERSKAERDAEFERRSAERDAEFERSKAEFERSKAEFERKDAALQKSFAKTERMIQNVNKQIGGMANSHGEYAEEFFYNALRRRKRNMLGEHFDDIVRRNAVTINQGYEDEYDILLVNGQAVCVVEVKYKADSGDMPQRMLRKAQTFRVNFPQHKDKKVYLALAGMSFHPLTEKACINNGIAVIKQVGETMMISDQNLKTF